jgi:hypothetical protein
VSAFHTALGGLITAAGVGMVTAARTWPAPGRHRRTVPLEGLLGEPSAYTTPAFTDVPDLALVAQGFSYCPHCRKDTAGVLHRDGIWTCGECVPAAHTFNLTTGD